MGPSVLEIAGASHLCQGEAPPTLDVAHVQAFVAFAQAIVEKTLAGSQILVNLGSTS